MTGERIDDSRVAGAHLRELVGSWHGTGRGRFPTIDAFRYREVLRFTVRDAASELHYEQRTWLVSGGADDGRPSHWESGFLLVLEDGAVELLNAQQSGRVEVLTGGLFPAADGRRELRLTSVVLAHDERMVSTRRVLRFGGDELEYEVRMATDRVAERQVHLQARLRRAE